MANIDPDLREDLTCAADIRRIFARAGRSLAFWEALCLVKTNRGLMEEQRRLTGELHTALLDHLDRQRAALFKLAEDFRALISLLPLAPKEPDKVEMIIALTLFSEKGRSSAARWVAFPMQYNIECAHTIRGLEKLMNACLTAVTVSEPQMEQAVFEEATPSMPAGVDADILAKLRRVEEARKVLQEAGRAAETWELYCVVMNETDLPIDAATLSSRIDPIRDKYHRLSTRLREYVLGLPIGRFGPDLMEMVIGFILASPLGRETAEQWVRSPESHHAQAAGRVETVISRAMKYQAALRAAQ